MYKTGQIIMIVLSVLVVLKSVSVGSDFNFKNWIKYKKKYTNWYFNREEFTP